MPAHCLYKTASVIKSAIDDTNDGPVTKHDIFAQHLAMQQQCGC